jgi:hypothetical protein
MIIRNRDRIKRTILSIKAQKHSTGCFIIRRPRGGLAEVFSLDGKAVVRPGSGGLLIVEWAAWLRFIRRHDLA